MDIWDSVTWIVEVEARAWNWEGFSLVQCIEPGKLRWKANDDKRSMISQGLSPASGQIARPRINWHEMIGRDTIGRLVSFADQPENKFHRPERDNRRYPINRLMSDNRRYPIRMSVDKRWTWNLFVRSSFDHQEDYRSSMHRGGYCLSRTIRCWIWMRVPDSSQVWQFTHGPLGIILFYQ